MRSRLFLPVLACAMLASSVSAAAPKPPRQTGLVRTAAEAKAIAERDTGGKAVSARRIPLNGASGGWEVEVRVPGESQGWRCVVDADTRSVHTKTRIPQPGKKGQAEGPVRMVKGSR